jgi:L-lactate dehydrogenase complex protein LldG
MSVSRELILDSIRAAIGPERETPAVAREYRRAGERDHAATVALLCERIRDYRADVVRVAAGGLPEAIARVFADREARRICVPAGVPSHWRPTGLEVLEDDRLSNDALDRLDGVLTGCTLAIAESGTIVHTAGPTEGRRALSLVPDLHVCVIEEEQVVELLPQAMATLAELVRTQRRPITLISGPSATSDIELDRVEGVHGPRNLVVIVVAKEPA